jgi:endoglucanase Acf2
MHSEALVLPETTNISKRTEQNSGSNSKRNEQMDEMKNKSMDGLLEEKKNLIISLEQSSAFI